MMTPILIIPNTHTITSIMMVILFPNLITITAAIAELATTVVEIVVVATAAAVEIKIIPQTKKKELYPILCKHNSEQLFPFFPAPEYRRRGLILKRGCSHLAEYDSYGLHESLPVTAVDWWKSKIPHHCHESDHPNLSSWCSHERRGIRLEN
jgi:hypothetical protein